MCVNLEWSLAAGETLSYEKRSMVINMSEFPNKSMIKIILRENIISINK